jgi:hypothetical protein
MLQGTLGRHAYVCTARNGCINGRHSGIHTHGTRSMQTTLAIRKSVAHVGK